MTIIGTNSVAELQNILAENEKSGSEARKNNRLRLGNQQEKLILKFQEQIEKLRDQQSQAGKSAWFSFFADTLLSMASFASNVLLPGAGLVVSKGMEFLKNAAFKLNPFQNSAEKAATDAKVLEKELAVEDKYLLNARQRIQNGKESQRAQEKRLEKAMDNLQKGHEAILRA